MPIELILNWSTSAQNIDLNKKFEEIILKISFYSKFYKRLAFVKCCRIFFYWLNGFSLPNANGALIFSISLQYIHLNTTCARKSKKTNSNYFCNLSHTTVCYLVRLRRVSQHVFKFYLFTPFLVPSKYCVGVVNIKWSCVF